MPVKTVAICGFGLIGGSIALDIQKRTKGIKLRAHDKPAVLRRLKNDKRFRVTPCVKLADAVRNADIVILAAPLAANERMLKELAKIKTLTNALILDTGSVKRPIVKTASKLSFANGTAFLPTHPMAGKESGGFANAQARLFIGHVWFSDDSTKLNRENEQRWTWLLRVTVAKQVVIAGGLHDDLMAEQSALPQLLSSILAAQISHEVPPLAGPGLRSMLRLAGSSHALWADIIDGNRKNILSSLKLYRDNLNQVIRMIGKKKSLEDLFADANRSYKCLS